MKSTAAVIGVAMCLACAAPQTGGSTPPAVTAATQPPKVDTGEQHRILDRYVGVLRGMAEVGDGGGTVMPEMEALDDELRSLGQRGLINNSFSTRMLRLTSITKLLVQPTRDGSVGETHKTISAFVEHVMPGHRFDPVGGLAAVSAALSAEILNLRMLTDGTTDREKAAAKYMRGGMPAQTE